MWPIDPSDFLSVCRGELQGAVLSKRLASTFLKETRLLIIETLFIIDSEIVLAQLNVDSHNFSVFVGHLVAEIRSETRPDQWYFTRGENNPCAELLSRGTRDITELGPGTTWQVGPAWLYTPRDQCPITQQTKSSEPIPELRVEGLKNKTMRVRTSAPSVEEIPYDTIPTKIAFRIQSLGEQIVDNSVDDDCCLTELSDFQCNVIEQMFDLSRHDDFQFWLGVTYRVLQALSWKKGDSCFFQRIVEQAVVTVDQRNLAKLFWIKQAQKILVSNIKLAVIKLSLRFSIQMGSIVVMVEPAIRPPVTNPFCCPTSIP